MQKPNHLQEATLRRRPQYAPEDPYNYVPPQVPADPSCGVGVQRVQYQDDDDISLSDSDEETYLPRGHLFKSNSIANESVEDARKTVERKRRARFGGSGDEPEWERERVRSRERDRESRGRDRETRRVRSRSREPVKSRERARSGERVKPREQGRSRDSRERKWPVSRERDRSRHSRERVRDSSPVRTAGKEKRVVDREKSIEKQGTKRKSKSPDAMGERLGRLENLLEQFLMKQAVATAAPSTRVEEKVADAKFQLLPRSHTFTTSRWINKVQEVSIQNNYDEPNTIKFMESQMSGIVKTWYKSLSKHDLTWPEWKLCLTKTFPDNTDFVITLKRLVTRLKMADETMNNYYYSKMYLMEACKISGTDAVALLIDGLNNQDVQDRAKAQNFLTPESLYSQFLTTLPKYPVDYTPPSVEPDPPVSTTSVPPPKAKTKPPTPVTPQPTWHYQENSQNFTTPSQQQQQILIQQQMYLQQQQQQQQQFHEQNQMMNQFRASEFMTFETPPPFIGPGYNEVHYVGEPHLRANVETKSEKNAKKKNTGPVHTRLDKRFMSTNNVKVPLEDKICDICEKRGHIKRACPNKVQKSLICEVVKSVEDEEDPTSRSLSWNSFKKICTVNGQKMSCFVDTGCATVTMRKSVAMSLGLKMAPTNDVIAGFGNCVTEIVGRARVGIELDSVKGAVDVAIVPDFAQDYPIIVGQPFFALKDVVLRLENGELKIYENSSGMI